MLSVMSRFLLEPLVNIEAAIVGCDNAYELRTMMMGYQCFNDKVRGMRRGLLCTVVPFRRGDAKKREHTSPFGTGNAGTLPGTDFVTNYSLLP